MNINEHAKPYPTATSGTTMVIHMGMCPDNFTADDAAAVTALLSKHGLADRYVVHKPNGPALWYILAASTPLPVESDEHIEDLEEDQYLTALNMDDETHLRVQDDDIPGEFLVDLLDLLYAVAARHPSVGSIEKFVVYVSRKSLEIQASSAPAWSDYRWLLRR